MIIWAPGCSQTWVFQWEESSLPFWLFLSHFEVGFCRSLASFSLPALQPAALPSTHRVPIPLPANLGSVEGGQVCSALPQLPRFAAVQWALERAGPRKLPAALPLCTWQWPVSATHCQRVDLALLHREKARPMSLCMSLPMPSSVHTQCPGPRKRAVTAGACGTQHVDSHLCLGP